jgi:uncharacterized membrane protein
LTFPAGALVAAVVMGLLQIAVPLTDDRAGLTTAVVVAFALTTTLLAAATWGGTRAVTAAALVVGGTLVLEAVGSRTGWPFGDYDYGDALRPTIAGVPLAVALAWWAMAVPAREVAARLAPAGWRRIALGAVALTAWDVFLDPQMGAPGATCRSPTTPAGSWPRPPSWSPSTACSPTPATNRRCWPSTRGGR